VGLPSNELLDKQQLPFIAGHSEVLQDSPRMKAVDIVQSAMVLASQQLNPPFSKQHIPDWLQLTCLQDKPLLKST
jgi:hypothetical protein